MLVELLTAILAIVLTLCAIARTPEVTQIIVERKIVVLCLLILAYLIGVPLELLSLFL